LYGKQYTNDWAFGYELYLTNGFDDTIISNEENKTFLPASKDNPERFEESSNGKLMTTGKMAVRHNKVGEIGLSYMGGVFNQFMEDGVVLDKKRRVDVMAVDFNTELPVIKTRLIGEWAWVYVDVPDTYGQQFGDRQQGGFVDIVQPVIRRPILGFEKAVINLACRLEYVDWNVDTFIETGGNIGDRFWSVVPAISFRPTSQSVIRVNYRRDWREDLLGNSPSRSASLEIGISSYF
jgi:hypothetical protein